MRPLAACKCQPQHQDTTRNLFRDAILPHSAAASWPSVAAFPPTLPKSGGSSPEKHTHTHTHTPHTHTHTRTHAHAHTHHRHTHTQTNTHTHRHTQTQRERERKRARERERDGQREGERYRERDREKKREMERMCDNYSNPCRADGVEDEKQRGHWDRTGCPEMPGESPSLSAKAASSFAFKPAALPCSCNTTQTL
jgi:hypothetical protein